MDRQVIAQKLESLRRSIKRVEDRRPPSPEALVADVDAQDILAINLTRAVQICVDIGAHVLAETNAPSPDTMGQTFESLVHMGIISPSLGERMKKAVGFRNIAVHSYQSIDWRIVYAIASERLVDFLEYARAIDAKLGT